ncbi:hypothetical protein [Limosilactobacillus vaginalis]|nr:hypothetical protein [Limosilactobacillus vaginalis]MDM8259612.1 hypothetical protein [Limosilactobacillus vaginalis]
MPLSDTLKDLMNAGQNRLGSVNKLSIPDLITNQSLVARRDR